MKHWTTRSIIVKNGDLVLQEQFAMQLITQFQRIFDAEGVPLELTIYRIMSIDHESGLIEVIPNSVSLDNLKKKIKGNTLLEFFKECWSDQESFKQARVNFIRSVAAYSLVCYFLQVKDRHNGNIMLTSDGHIVHIDFGYLLGRTMKFEKAPFKLTEEISAVMGGRDSSGFKEFTRLFLEGFLAIRKHYEKLLLLIEMSVQSPIMRINIHSS